MTIRITDDEITSTVSPHRATRCPGGWAVTWLGDRTVDRDLAIAAMKVAEFAVHPVLGQAGEVGDLVDALGLTIAEVVQLIEDSKPAYTHQAIISADAPPRPACGDSGPSVARAADVTCPDCLTLAADRKARTEVHDTHAISVDDEPDLVVERDGNGRDIAPCLVLRDPSEAELADFKRKLDATTTPTAKTHDLSVDREHGNIVITVADEDDAEFVYLTTGVALDLGRALARLTPAQIALLIGELTGGEK